MTKTHKNSQLEELQKKTSDLEKAIQQKTNLKRDNQLKLQIDNLKTWHRKVNAKLVGTPINPNPVLSAALIQKINELNSNIDLFIKDVNQVQNVVQKIKQFVDQNSYRKIQVEARPEIETKTEIQSKPKRQSLIQKPTSREDLRERVKQELQPTPTPIEKLGRITARKRSLELSLQGGLLKSQEHLGTARELVTPKTRNKKVVHFGTPKFVLGTNNLKPEQKLTQFVLESDLASVEGLLKRNLNSGAGYKISLAAKKKAFEKALENKNFLIAEVISDSVLTATEKKILEAKLQEAKGGKSISELFSPENALIDFVKKCATRHYVKNPIDPLNSKLGDELKSIHGFVHCLRTTKLAEKLFDIYQSVGILQDSAERSFIALLAAFHDASRVHEKLDKNEFPNGELFYQFALENGFSQKDAILGGLIISCKGVADGKLEDIVRKFLSGNKDGNGNGVEISKKVSDKDLDGQVKQYVDLVREKMAWINIINLADTIEVMRVRLASEDDVKEYNNGNADVLESLKKILPEDQYKKAEKAFLLEQNYLDQEQKEGPKVGTGEFGIKFVLPKIGKGIMPAIDENQLKQIETALVGLVAEHKKLIVDDVKAENKTGYFKEHRLWERKEGEVKFLLGVAGVFTEEELKNMELSNLQEVEDVRQKVNDHYYSNNSSDRDLDLCFITKERLHLLTDSIELRDSEKDLHQEHLATNFDLRKDGTQGGNFDYLLDGLIVEMGIGSSELLPTIPEASEVSHSYANPLTVMKRQIN